MIGTSPNSKFANSFWRPVGQTQCLPDFPADKRKATHMYEIALRPQTRLLVMCQGRYPQCVPYFFDENAQFCEQSQASSEHLQCIARRIGSSLQVEIHGEVKKKYVERMIKLLRHVSGEGDACIR